MTIGKSIIRGVEDKQGLMAVGPGCQAKGLDLILGAMERSECREQGSPFPLMVHFLPSLPHP